MPLMGAFPQDGSDGLVIVHVSGMRSRAGVAEAGEALLQRLDRDLARFAAGRRVYPDLIAVTGDLADSGLPGDYQQALDFLTRLADTAGVPHRHVVVVPGSRDVNHRACEAHFNWQAGEGRAPVPPYFPKWSHYAAALAEFYADCPGVTFTPDEPWTLFEMPELRVVVAGLNSTMAVSHQPEDQYQLVSQVQLDWFTSRLSQARADGWHRLAAIHDHAPRDASALDATLGSSGLVSMLLSGNPDGPPALPSGVPVRVVFPGGYQIVIAGRAPGPPAPAAQATTANAASRDAYFAQGNITIYGGPEAETAADTFLARVAEVTQLRFPAATVTEHGREGMRYLRVSVPTGGGMVDVYPIGVIDGDATDEGLEAFVATVHSQFAAADPKVRSEVVYKGTVAEPELPRYARRQGVRMRSFIDYQGLLDLGPLTEAQRARLDTDSQYPERLYIKQRFTIASGTGEAAEARTDLIAHAVNWLDAAAARLLVVLGDFGRGKTSFLRQLTRLLTREFPDLSPILVQLRDLEKGPTLDDLLAQHLYRNHVEDVTRDKLRYMIDKGKVVLLFDGFDELELRVGYDSAADYLQGLLNSLTGEAKVVLTSRTQHFLSTGQVHQAVRTGLGQRIETWTGTRVVILEDFTESQILEFLTSLYTGDGDRAQARLSLISNIANLLDLTRNPRMLAFVAGLDEWRLLAVQAEGGYLTAAGLYKEIIDYWLAGEEERHHHRRGLRWLGRQERFAVCTTLALLLWRKDQPAISLHELSDQVTTTLHQLSERRFTSEQATHSIASGSLLVRTADEAFTFIHRSVMEWLVAAHAAGTLHDDATASLLATRRMSPLMAAFLADLAGYETARAWAARTLADRAASETAKQNALAVWNHLRLPGTPGAETMTPVPDGPRDVALSVLTGTAPDGPPAPLDLAGVDLRSYDLNWLPLRGANLRGAVLRGMRLDGIDLSGADLTGADLSGVTMTGGSLDGATLTGSNWDQAAILGTAGTQDPALAGTPELAPAAVTGRDRGEVIVNTPNARTNCIAFAADGSLLAFGSGREVKIADPGTGRVLRVLPGHQDPAHHGVMTAMAFSPDATMLATGCTDGSAHTWDVATGAYRIALVRDSGRSRRGADAPVAHDDPVTAIAFSPDGALIATASTDFTARIWDAATGTPRFTCPAEGAVTQIAFSPDASLLTTVSSRQDAGFRSDVSMWDIATGVRRFVLPEDRGEVHAVAFSPGGGLVAAAYHDQTVVLWETATGDQHATLAGSEYIVKAIAFTPDGTVRTASHTPSWSEVHTWDAITGAHLDGGSRSMYVERRVSATAFSADLALVATAYDDRTLCIWDTATGTRRATLTRPAPATDAALSPDGTLISIMSADGAARIWDTATGTRRDGLSGQAAWASLLASPPDGTFTVERSRRDGTVRIRDAASGAQRTILTGHRDLVTAVAVAPDRTLLATASQDGTVHLTDIATETTIAWLVLLDDGGLAVLRPDGGYKLDGDPGDRLWWAIKLRCFAPGELDPYCPEIRRLPADAPILA